ncbi:hypothetical protein X744_29690 [Mesorhizobium sp. LNJC372A00]|nr:hypothetical protein X745_30855 [Mesorhizobium sp. LNJC374B00]ESY52283.1 hypothetical protein X744_29690 [Mesorhizobium sp. LNJC372A00]
MHVAIIKAARIPPAQIGRSSSILECLQNLSKPFGTQIDIENGVRLIRL